MKKLAVVAVRGFAGRAPAPSAVPAARVRPPDRAGLIAPGGSREIRALPRLLYLALALPLMLAVPAAAAPPALEWMFWHEANPASTARVDHAVWDGLLARYVVPGSDGINRFRYAAATPGDRQALATDLDRLAGVPVRALNRAEQMAYWINLYNELTVKVVLDHYPVKSIRDIAISPGLFAVGPWGRKLITIEGQAVSLDDIEHRILRPIWRDPRVHYAVNCASLGCPNLARRAYDAQGLEAMLDSAARAYVNHPRGASVVERKLVVSSIYIWFKDDFGGDDAGVIRHLKRYAEPVLTRELFLITRIDADHYDWHLNDAAAPNQVGLSGFTK